jgi:serine/threonine protein phosphatase PrpC
VLQIYWRDPYHQQNKQLYLLVSSDGLRDPSKELTPQRFADLLKHNPELLTPQLSTLLAQYAHRRGSKDNLTAVIARIDPNPTRPVMIAVADGHGRQGADAADTVIASFRDFNAEVKKHGLDAAALMRPNTVQVTPTKSFHTLGRE